MKEEIKRKFSQARSRFPHTSKVAYFNAAANGPYSIDVKEAVDDYVDNCTGAVRSFDVLSDDIRQGCARIIGASAKQVGLGHNTSVGLNIAAFGLPLKPGDEVLVSNVEFPAIVYIWKAAAEARGLKLKFVRSHDRCFNVDELEKAIGRKTRVLSVSWIQFFNGYKNDLKELSEKCRKHGMYSVIDGIQGVGVEPVNVRKLGIDIFSSGCHKWLLAPIGSGFFYLSDRVRDTITRPFASWLGVNWKNEYTDLLHYDRPGFDSARRFEMGYYASVNLLGMRASLKLFQSLGTRNIQRHNHALIDRLADYIRRNPYYRITSSMESRHRSSIFTFTCADFEKLHKTLLKAKIIQVHREGSIRVAVHLYNNEQDIDRMIGVLERFSR
jgi:selenocysteine lyase/cysteine desulfurase